MDPLWILQQSFYVKQKGKLFFKPMRFVNGQVQQVVVHFFVNHPSLCFLFIEMIFDLLQEFHFFSEIAYFSFFSMLF